MNRKLAARLTTIAVAVCLPQIYSLAEEPFDGLPEPITGCHNRRFIGEGGKGEMLQVCRDDLKGSPSWKRFEDEAPPLSPAAAIKAAQKALGIRSDATGKCFVTEVDLRRWDDTLWFYEIHFTYVGRQWESKYVAVTMGGHAILPVTREVKSEGKN